MASIDRSFSIANDVMLDYLAEGDFVRDIEDLALYDDWRNVDPDMLFALIRRMEFILPDYENVLIESVDTCYLPLQGVDRAVYSIAQILTPALIRVFRQDYCPFNQTESECAKEMLKIVIARSHEVRTLVSCWLLNRISVRSAVG